MDVLCVGHAAWDISVFLPAFPSENSKAEIETMLECGGGPAANAAYLLSCWGAACALAADLGADPYADRVLEEFAAVGTDTSLVRRNPESATPVSVILVNQSSGSRTIVNRKLPRRTSPLTISPPPAWDSPPKVLLFDGHELAASLEAMELFPQAKSILDAGSLREGTRVLAERVDYLVSSERFARQVSGLPDLDTPDRQQAALAALHRLNGRPVVITLGERGLVHGTADCFEHLAAFPVRAVDTTGAGDIFHGVFAYGVLTGLPWLETLRLASAAAARSVTVPGGRPSIPSLAHVQEMLRDAR
jgi:sugar/nucleoside kinase (ribokinase family)